MMPPPTTTTLWRWVLLRHAERTPIAPALDDPDLWRDLLPVDLAPLTAVPVRHDNGLAYRRPLDKHRIFGALTQRGLETATRVRPGGAAIIKARATNYRRTILTARACLAAAGCGGPVEVRANCSMSAFDTHPQATMAALSRVRQGFASEEHEVRDLKAALVRAIPGATAENFGWLLAVDYAEARRAHDFPSYGDDLLIPAKRYLKRRYDAYMADPDLRRLAVLPLLRDLETSLRAALRGGDHATYVNVAHDVTIISLMHGLNVDWPHDAWAPPFACQLGISLLDDGRLTLDLDHRPLRINGAHAFDAGAFLASLPSA